MKATFISDLHGHTPQLPGGDLLIIAGDLTARDTTDCYIKFQNWLCNQKYDCKIVIGGNHDNLLQIQGPADLVFPAIYLCDSGTEFLGLKIYGSPWTPQFRNQNPHAMAFSMKTDDDLAAQWELIPGGLDILVTHCPPHKVCDREPFGSRCGSKSLRKRIEAIRPRYVVFGHIHAGRGSETILGGIQCMNVSYVDENYRPRPGFVEIEI